MPSIYARIVLLAVTFALLTARVFATSHIGFGDSEALYASYALHPQPAYLDHPALIGLFARFVGHGGAPTPDIAHAYTTVLVTLVPFAILVAARAAGATLGAASIAAIAVAVVPEIAIGLFAMTPDLLLAFAWIGALAFATAGLRAPAGSARAAWMLALAGFMCGVGAAAKVTALLLFAALAATYLARPNRAHARTIWPWAGLVAGALVFAPVAIFEARSGFPMLAHRFIDTQDGAGLSVRNAIAVIFGQFAYLSPLMAIAAFFVARDLVRTFRSADRDPVDALLFFTFAIPLAVLVVIALVSRVAEPHWLAPPLLALPIHFARRLTQNIAIVTRRFARASFIVAIAMTAFAHAWVLVPDMARLVPSNVDARYDIANELFGWPIAITTTRALLNENRMLIFGASEPDVAELPVVGPHWVICAQLQAALGREVPVGCDTPVRDDFDDWYPRDRWRASDAILFVTDNRFPVDFAARFPDRAVDVIKTIHTFRGGRKARTFEIAVLRKRART